MATYNPAQQTVIDLLGRGDDEPSFPPGLAEGLLDELRAGIAPMVDELPPKLWVSKHALTGVHGCEARHVAQDGDFAWSVATVRGQVAHKAIELAVHWQGDPVSGQLVDEAIARLADADISASRFLGGLTAADRAQLRGEATDLVTKFQECFPPIRAAWRPVTESRVYVDLFDGAVVLAGKVDLTLGKHEPGRATKVIIDLKSGFPAANHRDDLRFYALLETLRLGVPPRMLASYYLDAARAQPEEVTVPLLEAALARALDGVHKLVELANGREPRLSPGPSCRWCPLSGDCAEGQSFLWSSDERGDDGDGR
jgi:hypothetical protein